MSPARLGVRPVNDEAVSAVAGGVMPLFDHEGRFPVACPGHGSRTAAGGTYPPELLPPVFASLGHFMPMRYSIEAFRISISGGLMSRFWFDVTLLALLLVSAIALLLIVVHRRRRFSMKDLHPPFG